MSEPYSIEPTPEPPRLWGTVHACRTLDDAVGAVAADVLRQAQACVAAFGSFQLAVSGDEMAEPIYRRLMYDPPLRNLPWAKTHLWLIDENAWALGEGDGRFARVRDLLAGHSGIPASQVHRIPMDEPEPGAAYQREIQSVLEWREKGHDRLDMALLCLSDDEPALADADIPIENQPLVAADGDRVSMTPRLLNASRLIGIVATGEACRERIRRLEDAQPTSRWRELRPTGGALHWYLDHDACPADADAPWRR